MKNNILILEPVDFPLKAVDVLREFASIDMADRSLDKINDTAQYDCIFTRLKYYLSQDIMKSARSLKIIASPTTGLNHIDGDAAEKLGITILSLKGEAEFLSGITATAEHAMALILSLIRNIPAAHNSAVSSQWDRDLFKGRVLKDKTLGIVGFGRLGKMVASYAGAFGMKVLFYDPFVKKGNAYAKGVNLDKLLKISDIITAHILYNEDTKEFFNADFFNKMKIGAYFINTSRGENVDEKALLSALQTNHLKGAALDVLTNETNKDFPKYNILIDYAKKENNLIITPHIGGACVESMEMAELFMAEKVKKYLMEA